MRVMSLIKVTALSALSMVLLTACAAKSSMYSRNTNQKNTYGVPKNVWQNLTPAQRQQLANYDNQPQHQVYIEGDMGAALGEN